MTRQGLKWRGGTPQPEAGDKAFSDVWWISQEVDKDMKAQLRQETIAKLLEDATRYDSSGMSESAIREARSAMTIVPCKNSDKRGSARRQRSKSQLGSEVSKKLQQEADDLGEDLAPRPHTRQGGLEETTGISSTRTGIDARFPAGGERDTAQSAVIKGGIGSAGKYLPHFRLAGRPKTAAQPMREGWGLGKLVFSQKNKTAQVTGTADEGESIYETWQQTSWPDAKKYHVRRSDVRSAHFNRLRYGAKVQEELPPPPDLAISGGHSIDPATAAPPSWVRQGSLIFCIGVGNFALPFSSNDSRRMLASKTDKRRLLSTRFSSNTKAVEG